ncbi:MAG: hypothetical protein JWO80_1269 [Bryobacterales bacterium]|nr:hypothetical protein [Bryobacterales bacterium]
MNLEKNYQLLDVLRDDGIRTLKAKEIASGRSLEVHLFMKLEDHALFDGLHGLPLSARSALLEFGSELKIPYIVTDPVPAETTARAWFTTLMKPVQAPPEPKPPPIKGSVWKTGTPLPDPLFPSEPDAPGDFTRMFHAGTPPKKEEPAPPGTDAEPGEFTRMFQVPAPSPLPVNDEPGDITRTMPSPVFQAPSAADEATRLFPIPQPATPPPPPKEPGEFTKMFESMQAKPANQPEPPKPAGPGEFTRMFQSPLSPGVQNKNAAADLFPASAVPPPTPNRAGEFTQLFGTPSGGTPPKPAPPLGGGAQFSGSATGAFAAPSAQPRQQRTPSSQGPGQFTQMMSAGAAPTLGQPQQRQENAPGKPKNANLPLIIILGALALFAILIVVFFAMRR